MSEWYYAQNKQQKGPVSAAELKQMAASGELRPGDLVWREGMQDWMPAGSAKGLFSERGAQAEAADVPRPRRRPRDDFDDEPPRRPLPPRGLSTGAKVGIIIAAVSGALVIAGVVVLVILLVGGSGTNFTLGPGQRRIELIEFQANKEAQITIRSDVTAPDTDVDLYVHEGPRNFVVVADEGPEKDCHVRFTPRTTQRFRVEIRNLGPGTATCNLSHNGTLRTR